MNKYIIEFIGTFFLVLIIGLTSNPIAIGLGLAVLVYMGAHISGAHYNPAVSLAMLINKKLSPKEMGFYIFFQLLAAVFATYTLNFLGNDDFSVVSNTSNISQFIVAEILFTFLLVFVILNVALNKNIEGIRGEAPVGNQVQLFLIIEVSGRDDLANVMKALKKTKNVISVNRVHSSEDRKLRIR